MKKPVLKTALFCTAFLLGAMLPPALAQQDAASAPPTADAAGDAPQTTQTDAAAPPTTSETTQETTPGPTGVPVPAAPDAASEPPPDSTPVSQTGAAPTSESAPKKSASLEPAPPAIYMPQTIDPVGTDDTSPDSDGVAAVVNDVSISDYEVRQRMALYIATAGFTPTADDLKRIRVQMLQQLEDEKLQLQEAIKKHITVSPTEVDDQINRMVTQNNLTLPQLEDVLTNAGASMTTLKAQITAQIAWQKTVQNEYSDRINISPQDVNDELQRYTQGADKPHYDVGEIFFAVDNSDQDAKVLKVADGVESQLHTGAPFQIIARQYSQSPSAASGGDIGWVYQGQMSPELDATLSTMAVNSVSPPIRSTGGYYILYLRARQAPLGTKINAAPAALPAGPDATLPLARLLLPMGPDPSKEAIADALKVANQVHDAYAGCEMLQSVPKQMQGAVFVNLGDMKLSDLSPDIRKALADTKAGEAAAPFVSPAGVEVIGRCDKKVEVQTAYTLPTRTAVENQLFQQQISVLARRYLRDLKRDSDVETR